MKNTTENSRRAFLSTSVKGAVLFGGAASVMGSLLNPAIAGTANQSDTAHRARIALLGMASLQTSQLALTKASNAKVKLFAKFEAAEQETMGRILKEMGTPVPVLDTDSKQMLAQLQQQSGAAYDKAFMDGQVKTHQKLREAVTAYKNSSNDAHVKHLTSLALATIQEHTERGQMLLSELA